MGTGIKEPRHNLSKTREVEQSMIACFHGSHAARKATFILVEQRRSMQGVRLNGAWGGNGVAPGVAPNPTVGTSEGEALGNYLLQLARRRQSTALVGATPGAHGSRSMLSGPGSKSRSPPAPALYFA